MTMTAAASSATSPASSAAVRAPHPRRRDAARWKGYRYMREQARTPRRHRRDGSPRRPHAALLTSRKAALPPSSAKLQSGDIIGICSHDGRKIGTSHVGLAYRTPDGVLRFMHASHPRNSGKVIVDQRLSRYLNHFSSIAGILVARPLK